MRRREFTAGHLGRATSAMPRIARAQPVERVRRVGVLFAGGAENDQTTQARIAAFRDGLAKLGWVEDHNLRIDLRFGGDHAGGIRAYAAELASLAPDVIVTSTAAATRVLQQQTQTIPIVITGVGDPVVSGIVKSPARPEANTTGVTNLFLSIGAKWLELLKETVPQIERVGLMYNPQFLGAGDGSYFPFIEESARVTGVKTIKLGCRDAVDIARAIDAFAAEPDGGLIVLPPPPTAANRETIRQSVARHRLPAIYQSRAYAAEGGLMSYGSDISDNFRRASYFVDRILRGAKVSELPVEFPTKFELVINLKTAKALDLTVPQSILVRADEVIE